MDLPLDPVELLERYGWYVIGATVFYLLVVRPKLAEFRQARALAAACDPTRCAGLDEKRAAIIARQQAELSEAAKNRPREAKKPEAKKKKPSPTVLGSTPLMGHRGNTRSHAPARRRPRGGGG